ncbi:hypothetical protein [Pseudomonas frederiksbergensis]|uniref:hypothetical protein n=1 Tax=Pseudomonas frederiksbergensis TaxID=104087 RepID=UPI003D1AF1A3
MDARTFSYYLWASPMVFACSAFYTVIVMLGLNQFITLEDTYFKAVELATYVIFCFLGLRYYAPKMKRIEFDETLDGRYTSVWASRIAIVIGASVGTIFCISFIDKIKFLKDLPHWLAVGVLFAVFAVAVFVFSYCVWKPGCRR